MENIKIGIDKTTLRGFTIKTMDINKLMGNSNVILQKANKEHISLKSIVINGIDDQEYEIEYLKITDKILFNTLMIGHKNNNGKEVYYQILDFSIADKEGTDNNVEPLTISEYHNKVKRIQVYLIDRYGLNIDFTNAHFNGIELNITALMEYDFIEYEYLLKQMAYLTPKIYKVTQQMDRSRYIREYKFENATTQGKIYDKTFQLMDKFKIKLKDQYMRIEYKINKSQNIKKALGTSSIYDLTDDNISQWLHSKIYKDLIKPIEKHLTSCNKQLKKMAEEEYKTGSKRWVTNFINRAMAIRLNQKSGELPLVLDQIQLENAAYSFIGSSNRSKTLKNMNNTISNTYPYVLNNMDKLQEIQKKFI